MERGATHMIDWLTIDISLIADMTTRVATAGALRVADAISGDDIFEYIVGVAVVIHQG